MASRPGSMAPCELEQVPEGQDPPGRSSGRQLRWRQLPASLKVGPRVRGRWSTLPLLGYGPPPRPGFSWSAVRGVCDMPCRPDVQGIFVLSDPAVAADRALGVCLRHGGGETPPPFYSLRRRGFLVGFKTTDPAALPPPPERFDKASAGSAPDPGTTELCPVLPVDQDTSERSSQAGQSG